VAKATVRKRHLPRVGRGWWIRYRIWTKPTYTLLSGLRGVVLRVPA